MTDSSGCRQSYSFRKLGLLYREEPLGAHIDEKSQASQLNAREDTASPLQFDHSSRLPLTGLAIDA